MAGIISLVFARCRYWPAQADSDSSCGRRAIRQLLPWLHLEAFLDIEIKMRCFASSSVLESRSILLVTAGYRDS